ncbi:MAG: DUF1572 family protein [Vicinamibacteria bacterium]
MSLGAHYLETAIRDFRKLKNLGEGALAQVADDHLHVSLDPESNSLAILVRHLAGNMLSRWTDFLTTDGEKPRRNRDSEFEGGAAGRSELLALWEQGWSCLFATLVALRPDELELRVRIRGEELSALEAIDRQMSHYGQHVGQIVFLAKHLSGDRWRSLSIPRGRSDGWRSR